MERDPGWKPRFGVVVFPGSNCDMDCYHVAKNVVGAHADYLWHGRDSIDDYDCIILPGGFSYGDYLRSGAIARFSPIMKEVERYASKGGLVIGICNGFQILLEASLLPGAMRKNSTTRFECRFVNVRVERTDTPFTCLCEQGRVLRIPIAHYEGNYFADPETLRKMEEKGQIIFRYCEDDGKVTAEANPNGSVLGIAGVCNEAGNILGLMPHPERASEIELGSVDGLLIFRSVVEWVKGRIAGV